jgi:predicted small metal-binding protein
MMQALSLSCKDLGTKECDYVAHGKTESEVKANMMEHASVAHPEAVNTEAREDALGRRIDKALGDKAGLEKQARSSGYGIEDGSQGGEFLDDGNRGGENRGGMDRNRDADRGGLDRDRKTAHQEAGTPRR